VGLYNFQKRFVPFIMTGQKTHTIRATRVHPDKPGDTLHLYTGLRLKRIKGKSEAKLLMRVPCVKVEQIRITRDAETIFHVWIDGNELDHTEKEALARRDGFADFTEMCAFWDARLPFEGEIIHWR
jgi:hypothetical protein